MGDAVIEELFVLVATVGIEQVTVIIAPQRNVKTMDKQTFTRPWLQELYATIDQALTNFKRIQE